MTEPLRHGETHLRLREEFVTVLLGLPLMQLPTDRQVLFTHLRERLGELTLPDLSEMRLQIVELVRTCARRERLGALVETVEFLQPGVAEISQLKRLLDEWGSLEIISETDFELLRTELATRDVPQLAWMYEQATEYQMMSPPTWCETAWHHYAHLLGQNAGGGGLLPALLFLRLLAIELTGRPQKTVENHCRRLAEQYRLTSQLGQRFNRLQEGHQQPETPVRYLIIQFVPDPGPSDPDDPDPGQDRYTVSDLRQWRDAEKWKTELRQTRYDVRQSDLPREVERAVRMMEEEWAHHDDMVVVEFVLPLDLLHTDVEWWERAPDITVGGPLALRYPVVVRSLERLRYPHLHPAWRERWRALQDNPTGSNIYYSRPRGVEYATRLRADLMSDASWVALVLSQPVHPRGDSQEEVKTALQAGLPIIVWHRLDCTHPAFLEEVNMMSSDGGVLQLPFLTKGLRLRAMRHEPPVRETHVGRHFAVLWDDPERPPYPPPDADPEGVR